MDCEKKLFSFQEEIAEIRRRLAKYESGGAVHHCRL